MIGYLTTQDTAEAINAAIPLLILASCSPRAIVVSPLAPRAVIVSEAARVEIDPADITPPEPALT